MHYQACVTYGKIRRGKGLDTLQIHSSFLYGPPARYTARVRRPIIFIDDNPTVLAMFCPLLEEELGVTVNAMLQDECTNEEVLDRIAELRPGVILLDGQLQGTSGPELAALIAEQDGGIPIVGFSSAASYRLAFLANGAADFVLKDATDPVGTARRVAAVVQRLLA